jgi:hypothetical protein
MPIPRTLRTAAILVPLLIPSATLGQSCSVTFETATVKPSVWDSFIKLFKSFNPKGQAERLSSLQQKVHELKSEKDQLLDTLNNVLISNSLPDWLEARLKQIPDIQNKVLVLLGEIRSEGDQGGLFAGDKSFPDLGDLLNAKKRDLSKMCVLVQLRLPLTDPAQRQQLQSLVDNLKIEAGSLGKIDDQLLTLVRKAHEEETSANSKQNKD